MQANGTLTEPTPDRGAPDAAARRPWGIIVLVAAMSIIAIGVVIVLLVGLLRSLEPGALTAAPAPEPAPAPVATAEEYAENTQAYDLATLPVIDVFTIAPALPVDDRPTEGVLPMVATPNAPGAALFADPTGSPVGQLPSTLRFDGTTVPVIEKQEHWARIMISGRAGLPSTGVVGQLTAWVRTADVQFTDNTMSVRVDIAGSSIQVLDGDTVVWEETSFAWGAPATPTPPGRTFIMTTRVDEGAGYTRGHPIVYLGLQSPTLDGFNGQNNAITAFHYHDVRSGAISNGCLRLDEDAIAQLSALPLGTPVVITGT